MDAPISEEDWVICLLASLSESYGVLITALEASVDIAKMEVVTKRLLHEERKCERKEEELEEKAMIIRKLNRRKVVCFNCRKYGHYKWDCPELPGDRRERKREDHKAHNVAKAADDASDGDALIVGHEALSVRMTSGWIMDSGATCHMCNRRSLFEEHQLLEKSQKVTHGGGHSLDAVGHGTVVLVMKLPMRRERG